MNTQLTQGKITPQLIALAIPLLIGNIIQQFYNTIDTIIVGRFVGDDAFAALGVAGTVMNLFIFVLGGCCTGVSMIAANLFGNGNQKVLRQEFYIATVMGTVFTVILSGGAILLLPWLLKVIQTPESITPMVTQYLNIIFAGMLATFFYNLFAAILRAVGNTRAALIFLIIAMAANTVLDILFVAVFHMGIWGASLATVIAQLFSALLCLIYILKYQSFLKITKEDRSFDKDLVKTTANYAIISALHQSSLYIGKLLVQGAVNALGLTSIAAYTATTRIEGIAQTFGDSGATAISVFVAQNFGAGKKDRAREGFLKGLKLLILLGLAISALMVIFAKPLLAFFVGAGNTEAIAFGVSYLRVVSVFYVLCFIGSSFVGYFRGSGMVQIPFIGTTMHITLRVIFSYLLAGRLGLSAVAWATGIGWISIVIFQTTVFKKTTASKSTSINIA